MMNLDFCDCFRREKLCLITNEKKYSISVISFSLALFKITESFLVKENFLTRILWNAVSRLPGLCNKILVNLKT